MKKIITRITGCLLAGIILTACSPTPEKLKGQLEIMANGESFIEEGFMTKDGWSLTFDHVYVGLVDIKAYQVDTAYDPQAKNKIRQTSLLHQEDMIVSDFRHKNILTTFSQAPLGHYNSLSWTISPSNDTPAINLVGMARKAGHQVPFDISFDKKMTYYAGEYVGENRKGFVKEDTPGDLEITLHIDHLFGDFQAGGEAAINLHALGFDPFFKLVNQDRVQLGHKDLQVGFAKEDLARLDTILLGLFHVGEGHTYAEEL